MSRTFVRAGIARKQAFLAEVPLEVDGLLTDRDVDEIEELSSDPMFDRPPSRKPRRDADRLALILDELDREGETK